MTETKETKKRKRSPKPLPMEQIKEGISQLSLQDKITVLGYLKQTINDEKEWFKSQMDLIPVSL